MKALEEDRGTYSQGDVWHALLALLPPGPELERRARTTGALRRKRGVREASDLLRVALSYGFCGLSFGDASAWARANESAKLCKTAVFRRLRNCGTWLENLLALKLSQSLSSIAEDTLGFNVRLVDATHVSSPGSKGDSWRVHAVYAPWARRLVQVSITDRKGGERLDRFEISPGDLIVGDRAYGTRPGIAHVVQHGGDFLVRTVWFHLPLETRDGQPFDLFAALRSLPAEGTADFAVRVAGDERHGIPAILCRVVAVRKPPEAAEEARRRVLKESKRKGCRVDPRTLEACDYFFVVTSLDPELVSAEQVLALYRLRWQIEIEFKRLKSLLRLDDLRARTPSTVRAALAAKMLGALLIEELVAQDSDPARHHGLTRIMWESARQAILGARAAARWLTERSLRIFSPTAEPRQRQLQSNSTWALLS